MRHQEQTDGVRPPLNVTVICLPSCNGFATLAFLDPFRIANYLAGEPLSTWQLVSPAGGTITASNGVNLATGRMTSEVMARSDVVVVSSSWTPEAFAERAFLRQLQIAGARGCHLVALDTGAVLLAAAGLLNGHRATVHYEHIDAFSEQFPDVVLVEDLTVVSGSRSSCCGGAAATDLALGMVANRWGGALANSVARYMFHERMRGAGERQLPEGREPIGFQAPDVLRRAIQSMEDHLEEPLTIPEVADRVGVSQRQLERLFKRHTHVSAVRYYRNARLDRARGLITQTTLPIIEVALASGFPSPENFSRAYKARFGLSPRDDRVTGRVPFEFRPWPMHGGQVRAQPPDHVMSKKVSSLS